MKNSKFVSSVILAFAVAFVQAAAAQGANVFTATGSLRSSRENHTATLLPNGKVLFAGGAIQFPEFAAESLASAEVYDPVTGASSPAASLGTARDSHTATLLPNGKLLVVGGKHTYVFTPLASAELYDPANDTWASTGSLTNARYSHTATLLANGKVLVTGGAVSGIQINSAELYDPATGTWSPTGTPSIGREGATTTLLPNGKVLLEGGYNGGYLVSAELYDPDTGTWSLTGSLGTAHEGATATLLPNGKVLLAGGYFTSRTELYNPATGTWSLSGSLATARVGHSATLLTNGQVLVAGGSTSNLVTLASAELYDPATGNWFPTGSLSTGRYSDTATLLPNGQVLVTAGHFFNNDVGDYGSLASVELYGPPPAFLNPITNPVRLGDGSFQFLFNANPNSTNYHILANTNPGAPLNTWSNLGNAAETPSGSGQFQFTDHQAPNYPRRFYRVSSP
jgi:hypothetical protein